MDVALSFGISRRNKNYNVGHTYEFFAMGTDIRFDIGVQDRRRRPFRMVAELEDDLNFNWAAEP